MLLFYLFWCGNKVVDVVTELVAGCLEFSSSFVLVTDLFSS